MANAATITAAVISFISLALMAIALATNSWIRFDASTKGSAVYDEVNGVVTNTQLSGLQLQYSVRYFGLWVVCHEENFISRDVVISCGFISSGCNATICWTRNNRDKTCQNDAVAPLNQKCTAFRTTRAFAILAAIFVIFGAALLLVASCITSRNLLWSATGFLSISVLFAIIAFAVFYAAVFKPDDLPTVSNIAWSFIMLIVAWPVAFFAILFAILGALSTPVKPYGDDDSE